MRTVVFKNCDNIAEAHLISGKLNDAGVKSFIQNQNFSNLMPHYQGMMGLGIQVVINATDLEEASKLIEDLSIDECPNCSSSNVEFKFSEKKFNYILSIIISAIFFIPLSNLKRGFICKECGHRWK